MAERWTRTPAPRGSSPVTEVFRWLRGQFAPADNAWERIASLRIKQSAGKHHVRLEPNRNFRLVKLNARRVDLQIRRWTLEFDDGSVQELSVGRLVPGSESRPMVVAGRTLKAMAVDYQAGDGVRRGQVEIWAQASSVLFGDRE